VYATLVEKGLPFERRSIHLGSGRNLEPEYPRLCRTSRVPTLLHGEFAPSESSAIVGCPAAAFTPRQSPSAHPRVPRPPAPPRPIQAWVRRELGALRGARQTTVIYGARNPQPLSEAGRRAADKLLSVADTLIDEQGGDLFGSWSIADVDFSVMLNRLCANGDPVPEKIRRYVDRQSERSCIKSWWALARQ